MAIVENTFFNFTNGKMISGIFYVYIRINALFQGKLVVKVDLNSHQA